eukprot:1929647-Rhodomonas_salina.1
MGACFDFLPLWYCADLFATLILASLLCLRIAVDTQHPSATSHNRNRPPALDLPLVNARAKESSLKDHDPAVTQPSRRNRNGSDIQEEALDKAEIFGGRLRLGLGGLRVPTAAPVGRHHDNQPNRAHPVPGYPETETLPLSLHTTNASDTHIQVLASQPDSESLPHAWPQCSWY